MDVYDFDGTLYRGDSSADFTLWCLRRYPRAWRTLPSTALGALGFGLGALNRTQLKTRLFRYLTCVPNIQDELSRFWDTHESNICGPCLPQPGDLVISASPEFLLQDVCKKRELRLLASRVNPANGYFQSPNCWGEQKVLRFKAAFPTGRIQRFYSDSRNDNPLAALAQEAFLVDIARNSIRPWE